MNGFPIPWLADSALCGSVAIVLLLLVRPLARRWAGARAVHLLWLIVLVRLLIPWTPRTPLALLPARTQDRTAPVPVTVRSFVVQAQAEHAPAWSAVDPGAVPERRSPAFAMSIAGSAALIWIFGAAAVFSLSLAAAARTARLVRRAREIAADSAAKRVLASLPVSVRRLRILETRDLKSPALCGILHPRILLPPGWAESLSPEELRCVLLHEIGHHRRGDVLWRWAFLVARAIHWFNPLVWVAEREMRIDQEMACDEWVLAHDGGIDSQKYGEVLLRACRNLTALRIPSPGHATMAESSAGLAQRIRHIARMKSHGWPALAGTAALAAALCVIGPSPGDAQNPANVPGDLPAKPAPASTPASASSSAPSPSPTANEKAGIPSGTQPSASASSSSPAAKPKEALIEIEAKFFERSRNALKDLAQLLPGEPSAPAESILEDSQFQVVVRALGKAKGVDLLSSPRVTCKSGQKAVIEMVRELRWPTEYNVPNDGSGKITASTFETRNVGLTLEVLPTVGAGGRIDMVLNPSEVELVGFVIYGGGKPRMDTLKPIALAGMMQDPPTRPRRVIRQPIFDTRKISTSASIQSGQTVIVGGVGSVTGGAEPWSLAEWEDVNRLFSKGGSDTARSKGKPVRTRKTAEDKTEKYLLIFVTARILNAETP